MTIHLIPSQMKEQDKCVVLEWLCSDKIWWRDPILQKQLLRNKWSRINGYGSNIVGGLAHVFVIAYLFLLLFIYFREMPRSCRHCQNASRACSSILFVLFWDFFLYRTGWEVGMYLLPFLDHSFQWMHRNWKHIRAVVTDLLSETI